MRNSASAARLHAVPLNESESFSYKIHQETTINNKTLAVTHINEETHPEKRSDDADRIILVDMHGRLADNLFEVAFAKTIA